MLARLSIRDIVLIDRLELTFTEGLSVLTGETGAGKSILLDAFSLALGARGDGGLVRHGETQGQVTAVFDCPTDHPARRIAADAEIDTEGDLILRRVQVADGRTRAFVNDQPVSVAGTVRITREYWWEIWLDSFGHEVKGDALKAARAKSAVWPPKPAPHSSRCGWSQSFCSSANVWPPSDERQTAPGSVPAHTVSGSRPAASCQTRSTLASLPSGNRMPPSSPSFHVAPRSSERRTRGPSHIEDAPAYSRGTSVRLSTMQE